MSKSIADKKSFYQKKILKELYFADALSCAEIGVRIDKSFPITTKLLSDLLEEGYITETGFAPSTGGRRPLTYALQQDVMYIVAVAMDQFVTRICIMNMHNQFVTNLERFELPLPENAQALDVLIEKIDSVIQASGIARSKIVGVGIGMPGFVDVVKGINYSFLPTEGKNLTQYISDAIALPVFIDNDSSLIALAELRFGAAREKKNAMVINIGWGIGLGLIINGELFRGQAGFAGEFSHIPLFSNGKMCSCGKTGCLETESSLLVVVDKAMQGLSAGRLSKLKGISSDHLEEASDAIMIAAQEGDQFAVELISEAGYNIGRGVAILIHILNPEIVILSGRGATAGRIWQAPIQQALNANCIPRLAASTAIEISTLGYKAELIGAAALVMEHFGREVTLKNHFAEFDHS